LPVGELTDIDALSKAKPWRRRLTLVALALTIGIGMYATWVAVQRSRRPGFMAGFRELGHEVTSFKRESWGGEPGGVQVGEETSYAAPYPVALQKARDYLAKEGYDTGMELMPDWWCFSHPNGNSITVIRGNRLGAGADRASSDFASVAIVRPPTWYESLWRRIVGAK
jgi:hypothetical protein